MRSVVAPHESAPDPGCPRVPDLIVRYSPSHTARLAADYAEQSKLFDAQEALKNISIVTTSAYVYDNPSFAPEFELILSFAITNNNPYPVTITSATCEFSYRGEVFNKLDLPVGRTVIASRNTSKFNEFSAGATAVRNFDVDGCSLKLDEWSEKDGIQQRF